MISDYISEDIHFEFGYSHSYAPLQSHLKLKHCKQHKAACHPMKCDVINDVNFFPTRYAMLQKQVYYNGNFMTYVYMFLSNLAIIPFPLGMCVQCVHVRTMCIGMLSL